MTVDNLYNNLHRSTSGWDEDFLTEALTHLLRYLQEFEQIACSSILNRLTDDLVQNLDANLSQISISTQLVTTHGTPDICIKHPTFLVLVEVKVDADFSEGQLAGYREILTESGSLNVRLITLTRYGQAGDHPDVDVAVRWNQVADWLEQVTLLDKVAIYLRNQFVGFLKQRGVAMDKVEWDLVPGTRSLLSLLNMILEAMSAAQIINDAATAGKNWQGYFKKYDGNVKVFMGIFLTEPAIVCVQIQNCSFRNDLNITRGEVTNGKWTETLDLASEEIHFFARSKQSQLACLEEFLSGSFGYADQLIVTKLKSR